MIFCVAKNRKIQVGVFLLTIVALFFTKSRSGIAIIMLVLGMMAAFKEKLNSRGIVRYVLVLLLTIVIAYLLIQTAFFHETFSSSTSTINGRLVLWSEGIKEFLKHPLIGNGFSQVVIHNNPHNFIISILMRSGISGLLGFGYICIHFIRRFKLFFADDFVRGVFYFSICVLIHSLVEIVLFSYINDIMLWFLLGCAMRRINTLKRWPCIIRWIKNK